MALLGKINQFAKNVGDKAGGAIETSKLNSKINSEQNAIDAVMKQIGEFYYAKYAETGTIDEGAAGFCTTIDGHKTAIAEANAEIERIKAANTAAASAPAPSATGGAVCTVCGKVNATDRKFCGECGGKLEIPVAPEGRVCPACGAQAAPGLKFCGECGAKLEADKRICACGAQVAPGARFCNECGAKFEEGGDGKK
jgi:membrane protease subunit (stomatin/prohibitin family)